MQKAKATEQLSEFKKIVEEIVQIQSAASCAGQLLMVLAACEKGDLEEARRLGQESWQHLDMWYHGLEAGSLTCDELPLAERLRMSRLASLIEKAQDFLISQLEVRPTGGLSDWGIKQLYKPQK